MRIYFLIVVLVFSFGANAQDYLFRDSDAPVDKRIDDLISRLTLEEKISLTGYRSPGVPRLGIAPYNWWNEALHGVARAGSATVFPQAIALAATFNDDLMLDVADAISTEARAKYNLSTAMGRHSGRLTSIFFATHDGEEGRRPMAKILSLLQQWA